MTEPILKEKIDFKEIKAASLVLNSTKLTDMIKFVGVKKEVLRDSFKDAIEKLSDEDFDNLPEAVYTAYQNIFEGANDSVEEDIIEEVVENIPEEVVPVQEKKEKPKNKKDKGKKEVEKVPEKKVIEKKTVPKKEKSNKITRTDCYIKAVKNTCKKGATKKDIMDESDRIYKDNGGTAKFKATNVASIVMDTLIKFDIVVNEEGIIKFK